MNKSKNRQEEIKSLLSIREELSVNALADYFNVTGATIRADLRDMEARNEISRSKGTVSLTKQFVINLSVNEKIFINAEQKKRIGGFAASMIQVRDFILMTSGTTIESMARQIVPTEHLSVVTPSVSVALTLAQKNKTEVYILGGKVQSTSLSVRDNYSLSGLENVSASKLFFSCDGFDLGTGVITAAIEEAALTKAMMRASHKIILLADSSKLGKTGQGHICDIKDVDLLITDSDLPERTREQIESLGVRVEFAL